MKNQILKETNMAFLPLANRVLIQREEEATTTASGIILPGSATEKPQQGVVIAVGVDAIEEGISEGDRVIFGKYGGTEITLDGKELLILTSDDILGILK
jgi:chaperonin GroES